jgi:hypothetical protein
MITQNLNLIYYNISSFRFPWGPVARLPYSSHTDFENFIGPVSSTNPEVKLGSYFYGNLHSYIRFFTPLDTDKVD